MINNKWGGKGNTNSFLVQKPFVFLNIVLNRDLNDVKNFLYG